jgi:hypothetical protein
MTLINNLGKKLGGIAQNAAKKSGDVVEITKLNLNINSEEDSIKKVFYEMGKYCYEGFERGEVTDEILIEFCNKIKEHKEIICSYNAKINQIKNIVICPSCGSEVEKIYTFCGKCGKELNEETEQI